MKICSSRPPSLSRFQEVPNCDGSKSVFQLLQPWATRHVVSDPSSGDKISARLAQEEETAAGKQRSDSDPIATRKSLDQVGLVI